MSDDTVDDDVLVQDELVALKARADLLGLTYHPSIGLAKLREKVLAATNDTPTQSDTETATPVIEDVALETPAQRRIRIKRTCSELVRIRVTCMNPAKKEWEGEILTVGNALSGTFRKYIPFNNDDGWHVPRIMYEQLRDRQCQVFTTVADARGQKTRRGKLIKEFALEILPSLTQIELAELSRRQAMAKSID